MTKNKKKHCHFGSLVYNKNRRSKLVKVSKGVSGVGNISDIIEKYLQQMLAASDSGMVEIKRSELAEEFQCVPSQINYVISTRFTVEKGYLVESKRGGGGFIRIRRARLHSQKEYFADLLLHIGETIPQITAEHVISRLVGDKLLTEREAMLIKGIISRETLQLPIPLRDELRARMLRSMVSILFGRLGG
jgi:transcriptional regulator CtsR